MEETGEITARGHFWLDDSENSVAGELTYSPNTGTTVYLFGALKEIYWEREAPVRYPVVRGHTETLGFVNLLEAAVVSQQFGTRPTASELHSNLVLHSSSATDFSRAPILRLTAEIDCLHEWIDVSGFTFSWSPDMKDIQMGFRTPNALEFKIGQDEVAFDFGRTGPTMRATQKEATICQSTYVSLRFANGKSLEEAIDQLLAIKELVALGVGKPLSWESVNAKFGVVSTEANGEWATVLGRPIGVSPDKAPHPLEMLFTFNDLRPRFGQALEAWLGIRREVRPLYTLYTATARGQRLYSEHRLFNFFQALESYHRVRNNVETDAKQKVKALKERMISTCTEEEREWLRDRLQHLGDLTAAERIRALIEQFGAQWIFDPDWIGAVRRITKLRNYFTHYSNEPAPDALDPANIYNDGSRLQVLCEQILMVEIGFGLGEAAEVLQRHRRLESLMVR